MGAEGGCWCHLCTKSHEGPTQTKKEIVPPAGIYLETRKYVDYGYFGNLEVFSGTMTQVITDVEGDGHFALRKLSGTWVNTGMSNQVWKKIAEYGKDQNADWVLKVVANAILVPTHMGVRLKQINRSCRQLESTWRRASMLTMAISAIWRCSVVR